MQSLLMTVIRFVMPQQDHTIKKLLLIFWEVVPKYTADGKMMQEMILVCDAYRKVRVYFSPFHRFLDRVDFSNPIEPALSLSLYFSLFLSLSLFYYKMLFTCTCICTYIPVLVCFTPAHCSWLLALALSLLSLSLPLFPFVKGDVLLATSSPPHFMVFSTRLCLLSSSSSLPPLLSSSHLS